MLQQHISLLPYNTFGLPAQARWFATIDSFATLRAALSDARVQGLPRLILGGGSNLVLTGDFGGLVLHMASRGVEIVREAGDAVWVRVQAGEAWHGFVQHTLQQGWFGLENLSLIPGTVGAAPIQNIGAYGVELETVFDSLEALDLATNQVVTFNHADCQFGYRDSIFKREGAGRYVILSVTFKLSRVAQAQTHYRDVAQELAAMGIDEATPNDVSRAVIAIRQRKLPDPAVVGNAGSFFKNPIVSKATLDKLLQAFPGAPHYPQTQASDGSAKLASAWLIDQCGWKGKRFGAAGVHPNQALVLINTGGATGAEVLVLAARIAEDVERRFGVVLEREPVVV